MPGCGWDACDPALQALLESSCQVCHPGSAAPRALPAPRPRAAPLCEPRGRCSGRQRSSARAPPAQGPYGTELAHCWEQPLPVRSGPQLTSFLLTPPGAGAAPPPPGACFAARACVAPIAIDPGGNRSGALRARESDERGARAWVAPAAWFATPALADIAGAVLEVRLEVPAGWNSAAAGAADVVLVGAGGEARPRPRRAGPPPAVVPRRTRAACGPGE